MDLFAPCQQAWVGFRKTILQKHAEVDSDVEFVTSESCEKVAAVFEHSITKFGVFGLKCQVDEREMAEGLAKDVRQQFIMWSATLAAIATAARAEQTLAEEVVKIGDDTVAALMKL